MIKTNNFLLTHMLINNEPDEAEMDGTQYQAKARVESHGHVCRTPCSNFRREKLPYEHQAYLKK